MRIVAIALGGLFVLSGGCTFLFWGAMTFGYAFDSFALTVAAIGGAVMALGIWIIVRTVRKAGRPPPP